MPHKDNLGKTRFTVKIPGQLAERIADLASDRRWSRATTIEYLFEVGVDSNADVKSGIESVNGDDAIGVSGATNNHEVVEAVEEIADEQFDGTFSPAARETLRRGLKEEGY
jgi:metal-responsive CopG/Arc/MetJ family transcriptional regulator